MTAHHIHSTLSLPSFETTTSNRGYTYNDTPYVQSLNRALQLEHVAIAIYAAIQRGAEPSSDSALSAIERTAIHHGALRQLVKLIFAQRGLPDSDPAELTALTGTMAARVSRYMPPIVQEPMLGVGAQRIELALARRYRVALNFAPASDRQLIGNLLAQVVELSRF